MAARGLYKATDGSWRQADAKTGVRFLYKLRGGERWTLLDRDRVMVVHPDRPMQSASSTARHRPFATIAVALFDARTAEAAKEHFRHLVKGLPFPDTPGRKWHECEPPTAGDVRSADLGH